MFVFCCLARRVRWGQWWIPKIPDGSETCLNSPTPSEHKGLPRVAGGSIKLFCSSSLMVVNSCFQSSRLTDTASVAFLSVTLEAHRVDRFTQRQQQLNNPKHMSCKILATPPGNYLSSSILFVASIVTIAASINKLAKLTLTITNSAAHPDVHVQIRSVTQLHTYNKSQ